MRGYVAVFAASYSVEEFVSAVSNVESICPTIAADTGWLARKLSGVSTEKDDFHGIVDEASSDVVKSAHTPAPIAILVRLSSLAKIRELGGLSRVTHSKKGG